MSTTKSQPTRETQEERSAYGVAAYRHYMDMKANPADADAWTGLAIALHNMGQTRELQAILARHALNKHPYQSHIGALAIKAYREHPVALSEWLKIMSKAPTLSFQERSMLTSMHKDMKNVMQHMEANKELLESEFGTSLKKFADQPIGLDLLQDRTLEDSIAFVEGFLTHETLAIAAVRELGFFPSPRSEKVLRRLCRDEATNPKIQTQAVLSLFWLGAEGNVKLIKFGQSHLITSGQSDLPLNMTLPEPLQAVFRKTQAWFALKQNHITEQQYEQAGTAELPNEAINALPSNILSIGNILLREAFLYYYPVFPALDDPRPWSLALIRLLQEIEISDGSEWSFPDPETGADVEAARQWLLGANPSLNDAEEEESPAAIAAEAPPAPDAE